MEKTRLETLGFNIKVIRMKKNISQEKLAEMIDVCRETISNIETGSQKTSILNVIDIARALNVDINNFIKDV